MEISVRINTDYTISIIKHGDSEFLMTDKDFEKLCKLEKDILFYCDEFSKFYGSHQYMLDKSNLRIQSNNNGKCELVFETISTNKSLTISLYNYNFLARHYMNSSTLIAMDVIKDFLRNFAETKSICYCSGCNESIENQLAHDCVMNPLDCIKNCLQNINNLSSVISPQEFIMTLAKYTSEKQIFVEFPLFLYQRLNYHYFKNLVNDVITYFEDLYQ